MYNIHYTEAEFLDVIGTKVFLFAIQSSLSKSDLKLICNVNIVYGNLMFENSQDSAQKAKAQ